MTNDERCALTERAEYFRDPGTCHRHWTMDRSGLLTDYGFREAANDLNDRATLLIRKAGRIAALVNEIKAKLTEAVT